MIGGGGGSSAERGASLRETGSLFISYSQHDEAVMSWRRPNDFNLVCIQQRMMESVSSRHKYPLNMPNSMKS